MPGYRWTVQELDQLEWEWTRFDIEELAKRLDRTPAGVREKARKMGLGSVKRGSYSLLEMSRKTGYDRDRILTAARRAGVNLSRVARTRSTPKGYKGRHYAISVDAWDRIVAELAKHPDGGRLWRSHAHEWGGRFRGGATKPNACLDHNGTDRQHYRRGYCRKCWRRREYQLRRSAETRDRKKRVPDRDPDRIFRGIDDRFLDLNVRSGRSQEIVRVHGGEDQGPILRQCGADRAL